MWAENLPEQCPPSDALPPQGKVFYRLVKTLPPTEMDYHSHRRRYPDKSFTHRSECELRSVSIIEDIKHAQALLKMPIHLGERILRIVLSNDSGVIKQSPSKTIPSHYSWWLYKDFNPLNIEGTEANE